MKFLDVTKPLAPFSYGRNHGDMGCLATLETGPCALNKKNVIIMLKKLYFRVLPETVMLQEEGVAPGEGGIFSSHPGGRSPKPV